MDNSEVNDSSSRNEELLITATVIFLALRGLQNRRQHLHRHYLTRAILPQNPRFNTSWADPPS